MLKRFAREFLGKTRFPPVRRNMTVVEISLALY
jgi:hypothetical protein